MCRAVVIALMLSVLICAVACDGSSDTVVKPRSVIARDSGSVRIVEVSGAYLDRLPSWTFTDAPTISIGSVDGEQPYLFSDVVAARRLDSGEIMVADGTSSEVRIFGPDGRFRRKYGSRGAGPGEYVYFRYVSESDGTRISIYDEIQERVTTMDLSSGDYTSRGVPRSCSEDPATTRMQRCTAAGVLVDGTLPAYLPLSTIPSPSDSGLIVRPGRPRRLGILDDGKFQALDSALTGGTVMAGAYTSTLFLGMELFQAGDAVATGADVFAVGEPDAFEIRVWNGNGQLVRIVRVLTPPTPVTAELLAQHRKYADTAPRVPEVARTYLSTLQPKGSVPFFDEMRLDRAGRIWLRDYQPYWAFGPTGPRVWTVLGADGEPEARIETGERQMLEIGAHYVLLLERDDDDVQYVRMYGIRF